MILHIICQLGVRPNVEGELAADLAVHNTHEGVFDARACGVNIGVFNEHFCTWRATLDLKLVGHLARECFSIADIELAPAARHLHYLARLRGLPSESNVDHKLEDHKDVWLQYVVLVA